MKHALAGATILLIQSVSAKAQIRKSQILLNDSLKYKSVQIRLEGYNYALNECRATGFFLHYKSKYYFVTNYHVLSGRWWEDTARFTLPWAFKEPDGMTVTHYSENEHGNTNVYYELREGSQRRNYFSSPVNYFYRRINPDLAFYEVEKLPGDALIGPVDLSERSKKMQILPNTRLYCFGFSKRKWENLYPYCDTLYTVGDSTFNSTDNFISVYNPLKMQGSSGAPVFAETEGKHLFIGVFFAVIKPEMMWNYPELFPRNQYMNPIGFIISAHYLKQTLDYLISSFRSER
jgi:hypothetical protein